MRSNLTGLLAQCSRPEHWAADEGSFACALARASSLVAAWVPPVPGHDPGARARRRSVQLDRAKEPCGLTLGLPQVGLRLDGGQQQVAQLPALGRGQPGERRAGGLHARRQLDSGRGALGVRATRFTRRSSASSCRSTRPRAARRSAIPVALDAWPPSRAASSRMDMPPSTCSSADAWTNDSPHCSAHCDICVAVWPTSATSRPTISRVSARSGMPSIVAHKLAMPIFDMPNIGMRILSGSRRAAQPRNQPAPESPAPSRPRRRAGCSHA